MRGRHDQRFRASIVEREQRQLCKERGHVYAARRAWKDIARGNDGAPRMWIVPCRVCPAGRLEVRRGA